MMSRNNGEAEPVSAATGPFLASAGLRGRARKSSNLDTLTLQCHRSRLVYFGRCTTTAPSFYDLENVHGMVTRSRLGMIQ